MAKGEPVKDGQNCEVAKSRHAPAMGVSDGMSGMEMGWGVACGRVWVRVMRRSRNSGMTIAKALVPARLKCLSNCSSDIYVRT